MIYTVLCQFPNAPFPARLSIPFTDLAQAYSAAIELRKVTGASFAWVSAESPSPQRF